MGHEDTAATAPGEIVADRPDRRDVIRAAASVAGLAVLGLGRSARAAPPQWYIGIIPDEPFNIRIVDKVRLPDIYERQVVPFRGPEPPGSLVVVRNDRFLYFVETGGRAIRFGISVGRQGMDWQGEAVVGRKAKWPTWTPTENMRARDPSLPVSVPGGPANPLGARALYLFRDGRDTLYRIHGTNQPSSIGKAASSGCVRMLDEHIFELYASVPIGTRVVVR
jgi:lipoprotein-anchoring transpeptidase ErfK/SrfK